MSISQYVYRAVFTWLSKVIEELVWFWFYYALWLASVFTLFLVLRQSSENRFNTQLHEKHNAQYKNKYINSHAAKQNWKNKKNCYRYHSSSQRSLSPFWFQLLTIFSSFIEGSSSEEIFITGNSLCSALWKSKSLLSHWLPATQILRLSNLIHIFLFKLLSILHVHSWHSDLSLRLWGPWSLNVLTISFVFLWVRGPAHYENTQCYFRAFSVGLPRTVCAFVSLTLDNILQQYVPRNTVTKVYPKCLLLLFFGAVRTCFDHELSKFSGFSWERILFLNSACVNMVMQIQVQIGDTRRVFYDSTWECWGFKKTSFCVRFRRHVLWIWFTLRKR